MATVKETFGDLPHAPYVMPTETPDPNDLWANYDGETDSLTIFLSGKPVPGMHVYVNDDVYVIVDRDSQVVGYFVEAWERRFLPAHDELRTLWDEVRPSIPAEVGWSVLLRMLALWLVVLFEQWEDAPGARVSGLQPA